MELQHFSRQHPLIFNEELNKCHKRFICVGCLKQMLGPNYICKKCPWFILHKSCVELPCELKHPLHPKHPLLLIYSDFMKRESKCDGCNGEDKRGFIYQCSHHCNFSLEYTCASLPLTIEAEIHHEHPLTLMRRSLTFTCDACGEEGKSMFYLCAICPFFVHRKCTSYPLLVEHIRHKHPLHLTKSFQQPQLNQSDHRVCLLCVKKVNTNLERTKLKCEDPGPSLLCCKYKYERATVRAY
jgi:hypothetical protein